MYWNLYLVYQIALMFSFKHAEFDLKEVYCTYARDIYSSAYTIKVVNKICGLLIYHHRVYQIKQS